MNDDVVTSNPWRSLRRHTPARIGLGRAGASLPTQQQLDFQAAHALARDAVLRPLDAEGVQASLQALGLPSVMLHSAAPDRATYLKRPDLGRQLQAASQQRLEQMAVVDDGQRPDLAVVIADGLSSLAIERHAVPFIEQLQPVLGRDWRWAPVVVVQQARVAIGDPIGQALAARVVVVLVGERPGLSAPDSMGLYITWGPRPGRTDAERNCVSNVRPEGLPLAAAAQRLTWLLRQARERQLTGVELKDRSQGEVAPLDVAGSFLLAE